MKKNMSMAKAMQKVEKSKEDKARDKRLGLKEGSPKDAKLDRAQARIMMHKSKVRSAAQKTLGGKY